MKKSRFILMLLALLLSIASYAQGILGTVTDDQGEPVIGASVVEKGNPQNGTITDLDGRFTITEKRPSKSLMVPLPIWMAVSPSR